MAEATTLAALVGEARSALERAGIADAALSARLLVEHFSQTTRADALLRPQAVVSPSEAEQVRVAIARRVNGEPVHRIIGMREFFGLPLALSRDTLEPRPDTEVLVDAVLPFLRERVSREGSCRILDLGTGTGAVALAVLSQVPGAQAVATDIAAGALETARENAETLGLGDRFEAVQSDWFGAVHGRFDAILSNPPYISLQELMALAPEVRLFDPERALLGGADGLEAYRAIANGAAEHLEPGGLVGLEIGWQQAEAVTVIFAAEGFSLQRGIKDLGDRDRALLFHL